MKIYKTFKKAVNWIIIINLINLCFGLPNSPYVPKAHAGITTYVYSGSYNTSNPTPIGTSTAKTAVLKIYAYNSMGGTTTLQNINFSVYPANATSSLQALAYNDHLGGVNIYRDSDGNNAGIYGPEDALVSLLSPPAWTVETAQLSTSDCDGRKIAPDSSATFFIVIRLLDSLASTTEITPYLKPNSISINGETSPTDGPKWGNKLVVDTDKPTVISAEKVSSSQVEVTYSEWMDFNSMTASSSYSFNNTSVHDVEQKGNNKVRISTLSDINSETTLAINTLVKDYAGNPLAGSGPYPVLNKPNVKISEVVADITNMNDPKEYIELYNAGSEPVGMNGWKIQYSVCGSAEWRNIASLSATITPYSYYLAGSSNYDTYADSSSFTRPDLIFSDQYETDMLKSASGSVRLFDGAKAVDLFGWGGCTNYEGTSAGALSYGYTYERKAYENSTMTSMMDGGADFSKGNGYDSDRNYYDFIQHVFVPASNPQSSTSSPEYSTSTTQDLNNFSIQHTPIAIAPKNSALYLYAKMGDMSYSTSSVIAKLKFLNGVADKNTLTPLSASSTNGDYVTDGVYRFNVPYNVMNSVGNYGLFYYLKLETPNGYYYLSGNPAADLARDESVVCKYPFVVSVEDSTSWSKHSITGTVYGTSSPVQGALIMLMGTGYSTISASDGSFNLFNVRDGSYNLAAVKSGFYEYWRNNINLYGTSTNIGNLYMAEKASGGGYSGDVVKPRLKWTAPTNWMTGISPNYADFKIMLSFSEDIASSSFNTSNIKLVTESDLNTNLLDDGDCVYDPDDRTNLPLDDYLGVVYTGALSQNTNYILILNNNVRDLAGNSLEGNRSEGGHEISFKTGADYSSETGWDDYGMGEMKPPYVIGSVPVQGAMNVAPNSKINLSFSDPMDGSTISQTNIKFYKAAYSGYAETLTSISSAMALDATKKIVTIAPTSALPSGKYKVIATGALKSSNGIPMGDPNLGQNTSGSHIFTTMFEVGSTTPSDYTKPSVIGSWPGNNSANVSVNPGKLMVNFSEAMDASSINYDTLQLIQGSTQVNGNIYYDITNRFATFMPSYSLSPSSTYSMIIKGNSSATSSAVTDLAGNPMNANHTITFQTSGDYDTQPPQIMYAMGDEHNVAISFSEPMNMAKITDSLNWNRSVLNPENYILKYGPAGTDFSTSGTQINLQNAYVSYDDMENTAIISGIGLDYNAVNGQDYYINMASTSVLTASSSGACDLSSNALSLKTSFQFPIQSSSSTKGMLGPATNSGSSGQMSANMSAMGIMKAGVFPMNYLTGQTTKYFVDIPTYRTLGNGYSIVLTFPIGFDISAAKQDQNSEANSDMNFENQGVIKFSTSTESSGGASDDGVVVNASARTITVNLAAQGILLSQDYLHFDLSGIVNSSIPRSYDTGGYAVDIKIFDNNGNLSENITTMPFYINQGGSYSISGSITLNGADGSTDGNMNLYMGSSMTGPMESEIAINNGSGNYSFSNLPSGNYWIYTDPVITVNSVDWNGLSLSEPAYISNSSTTKNFTFIKSNSGSNTDVTVNLSGDFNNNDIDVFASGPNGYRVKTIVSAGVNPAPIHLYLPLGNWYIGVKPAAAKTAMTTNTQAVDWIPPAPAYIYSSGSGTSSVSLAVNSANRQIIGYVKDASGSAITDADVYAYQPNGSAKGANTKTDTSGKFVLKVSGEVNFTVGAFKSGLPKAPDQYVQVKANTAAVDGNSTADIWANNALVTEANLLVFKLKKSNFTISGKLTKDGVSAVSNASVWANKATGYGNVNTMTDSTGNFVLYVESGTWNVNAYIPGYGNAESQAVVVTDADAVQNLSLPGSQDYINISGTVTINSAAQSYRPIRAIEFNSSGAYLGHQYNANTDSSGAYNLRVAAADGSGQKYYRIDIWTADFGEVGLSSDAVADNPANIIATTTDITGADINIDSSNLITATMLMNNKSGYSGKEGYVKIEGVACSGTACKPTGFNKAVRIANLGGSDQAVSLEKNNKYFVSLYIPGMGSYYPEADATYKTVNATTTDRDINFLLPIFASSTFSISGTVKDDSDNALSNAWVWINSGGSGFAAGTSTNALGVYNISVPSGSSYKIGANKPGYTPSAGAEITLSTATVQNFTLAQNIYTISGTISDATGTIAGARVRAATTDNTKNINAFTYSDGTYSIGVTEGAWKVYAAADGYSEALYSTNLSISSSNPSATANITLAADSNWINRSTAKPIIPSSGGTVDDSLDGGTGIKLVFPPNSLGNSSSNGNITAALTTAVAKTNSTEPFNSQGLSINATDSSGQPITNLNDYADIEISVYKSDVADAIANATSSQAVYDKLKMTNVAYWDSGLNDWIVLSTDRKAYYKSSSTSTEWTLYSNTETDGDFSAFIDTLGSVSYEDYKLVYSSNTNHLTIFAVVMPFVAASSNDNNGGNNDDNNNNNNGGSSAGGGSVPLSGGTCTQVTFGDWQAFCVGRFQYKTIKSKSPSNCTLTAAQEKERKKVCEIGDLQSELAKKIEENPVTKAITTIADKIKQIFADAADVIKSNVISLATKLGIRQNKVAESSILSKYTQALLKNIAKITEKEKQIINNFITYGTATTKKMGAGERAGVIDSYKSAFKKVPKTEAEWSDTIKIANGNWPTERNAEKEKQAKAAFKKIYKREPNLKIAQDANAISIMSYGIRPAKRNPKSEAAAVKTYRKIYKKAPKSSSEWDVVRAIAYSGAKR